MTRVLTIISSSYGGGAERMVLDQLKYSKGTALQVASLRKGNIEQNFRKYSNYTSINSKSRFSLKTLLSLNRLARKHKAQVLHTHLLEADIYGVLLKILNPKLKLISTRPSSNDPFRKNLLIRAGSYLMSLFMDRTIAVSEDVKKFLTKYEWVNPSKIVVVHPGIDTKRFTKQKGIRQKLGLSKKDFVIGIVGRLSPEKGHDLLIKAISGLKKPCRLVVLGEGKLKPSLHALAKKLNVRADFLGFREDMPAIYSSLDVLCLPSYFEGLPLVLAEAMSSECIFICSDIPNNREVAQNAPAQLFFEKGN
ncbi:glycosyltransferase, partial [Candidatus Woesearchaeota archaeon]|nr:glycosyltransferase [Candidatus Woesearchaeota archaeon]